MYPAITLSFYQPASAPRASEPEGLAALRRETEAKVRRLEESLLNLDNLLSPQDWLDAGDGFPGFGAWRWSRPATRNQDRSHAPINYLNEEEWRQHVALARDLVTRNHLALGFRDHVSNFIGPVTISFVLRGQTPGASASGPTDADGDGEPDVDPLVKAATQAWEEWRELAEWGEGEHDREAECRTRLIVEGECTLRFFAGNVDTNGLPYVRHVEPELIRTPPGHTTLDRAGWGVLAADQDDETEEAIWQCRADNPSVGSYISAPDYVRAKVNVDRTIKRGLSDLFPVAEHLRKVLGLLDNMGHVARLQSAIAWWEQYPTATEEQVRRMIQSGANYTRPSLPPSTPGRTTDVQNYEPGSIIRTEGGRQVLPGPVATGVAGYAQVEALLLRGVGFRWGCPSYFSGDADASFASVLVTGSPFVRITEARQEKVKGFARTVARRVLEFCERTGRLPRGTSQRVRPVATARPVVIADEEKKARTFLSLYAQKCASPIAYIRENGGDPKVVAAEIAAWEKKFAPQGGGDGGQPPPDGGAPAPKDPSATPPGSAGADGSSPNDGGDVFGDLLGEHFGRTAEGVEWISEAAYELLSEADRAHLVKRQVQDKNGNLVYRWVRVGAKPGAPERTGTSDAEHLAAKALKEPHNLTADEVKQLAEHLKTMPKDRLRDLNLSLRQKVGGNKAELADRLLEYVRGKVKLEPEPVPPPVAPPPAPAPELKTIELQHNDANHAVAQQIAADKHAVDLTARLVSEFAERSALAAEYQQRRNAYWDKLKEVEAASKKYMRAFDAKRPQDVRDKLKAEHDRLAAEADELGKRAQQARQIQGEVIKQGRDWLMREMKPANPVQVSLANPGHVQTDAQKQVVSEVHGFVGAMTNWAGDQQYQGFESTDGRAYYMNSDGKKAPQIAFGKGWTGIDKDEVSRIKATNTLVHEIGHMIEHRKPGLQQRAFEFLNYRVGSEAPVSLKQQFPGSGYDPNEMGRKDNFDRVFDGSGAYYVGKKYHDTTEIVPMGLEQMYKNPVEFASKDPEFFTWLVSNLRG